ncbi:MAG: cell division protein FtsA, partial [Terriglobales bacterium]
YIDTVATGAKQNLVVAANQAGLEVEELIFTPLAVAEASLRTEDRSLGVAVIEVGGGCTGLAVFSQNAVTHAGVIPVGGDHFTNDIAIAFNTPHREAEKIKCAFGFAAASYVQGGSQIEVPSVGDRAARMLPHRELCECIEPRAQELVRLIQEDLRRAGVLGTLGAGVLLSGGGSRLAGFPEMMESLLGLPVRPVAPALIQEMPDKLGDPEFAFALGATYYGHRVRARRARPKSAWQKAVEQLKRLAAD